MLLHHDDAVTSMDQHHIGQEGIILAPIIKDNSWLLLESKTCHWYKLLSIDTQKHVNLQEPLTTTTDTQATFLYPSQAVFPSLLNFPIHFIATLILAHPSDMKSSNQTNFHILPHHLFLA